jgi:hypothetical protein
MAQLIIRFLAGGAIVSLFAALGDVVKPKSFAGLFGAAPSVALATLGLTVLTDGKAYAATEARSMIVGSGAFFVYAFLSCQLMMRFKVPAIFATVGTLVAWFAIAAGAWFGLLR